jgi:cytochrome c biogenesis protein CcdA
MEGNFAYSFLLGVLASVNPCGFVMLPAYLAHYLGFAAEDIGSSRRRGDVGRALVVSAAVSSGFVVVFVVVGVAVRSVGALEFLASEARWVGMVIGVVMVIGGAAMLVGWTPRIRTGALGPRPGGTISAGSMFVFGLAYATASIGCTIGLFVAVILGSFTRSGVLGGIVSTVLYAAGMGAVVTALTVSIAVVRGGLSRRLRAFSRYVPRIGATIVLLSGLYLTWYWYSAIFRAARVDSITGVVGGWQTRLAGWIEVRGVTAIAVVLGSVTAAAVLAAARRSRSVTDVSGPDQPCRVGASRTTQRTDGVR